ncbi:MAG: hypothetical protein JW827_11130 [Spirochaetes bacterium]|nr:hypothetical protein [Spirochaetota bacterium]
MSNKGWVLLDENNTHLIIKGVCYSPIPIGRTAWEYDIFTDENKPWFIDGDYMERMGVNTVRIYSAGKDDEACKKFIRQMYKLYSVYTLFPLPLTMHGADFSSEAYKEKLKKKILDTVREYKNTPGVLLYLLGNEIDYFFYDDRAYWETSEIKNMNSSYRRAKARAEIIFEFIEELVSEIKKIDNKHPVGVSLGKTDFFNILNETLPGIDYIGLNQYQGKNFSSVWSLMRRIDKPILITEFGYDAFNTKKSHEDEQMQANFIVSLWNDIYKHSALESDRAVSLGGCIFEWTDEWWKYEYSDPKDHDTVGSWPNAAWPDFTPEKPQNVQEEWFGLFRVEPSTNQYLDTRTPRLVFHKLKALWNPAVD